MSFITQTYLRVTLVLADDVSGVDRFSILPDRSERTGIELLEISIFYLFSVN